MAKAGTQWRYGPNRLPPWAAVDDPGARGAGERRWAQAEEGRRAAPVADALGHLLTLPVTPAVEQERAQVGVLLGEAQAVTGGEVERAWVAQGRMGAAPAMAAAEQGVTLEAVKLPEAKRGCVLLPRRWPVARSSAVVTGCTPSRWDEPRA